MAGQTLRDWPQERPRSWRLVMQVLCAVAAFTSCQRHDPIPDTARRDAVRPEPPASSEAAPSVKSDVAPPSAVPQPPAGFAELGSMAPQIPTDIRYATKNNFTGAPLPGYTPGIAWLTIDAAEALATIQSDLAPEGLGLLVYDAYRPIRATQAMVRWAEKSERSDLLGDGYIARSSNHNRGNTVDLTLVDLESGEPLDMGTPWDTFSGQSHYAAATGVAMENRRRLRDAMRRRGFAPYNKEWWHFTFEAQPPPPARDIPYP